MAKLDIKNVEKKWKAYWEKEGIYSFDKKSKKKTYSIDTPPPTVSGKMHIGHACSYSQQDFIARFKRMQGYNVFYPFGTDDNGLPTERLVEKEKGIKSKELPRDEFIKICMKYLKEKAQPEYLQDWKNIGISCDWNIVYSTIDDHARKVSQWSFIDLYKKKRAYRQDAPAMYCPHCKTGIAQVELQDKEFDSTFNDIAFNVEGKELIIATTRPELLPACVAVFYSPGDKRYEKLKGKKATVPLFNFEVPIMEDKRVDPEKGTGIVMCCTFGDQVDMEWQKAYKLPIKMAISPEGCMTNIASNYENLSIKKARKAILDDLKEQGLLKKQKPIKHAVNVHERCGTEIEIIKSKQWFVKYLDLKKQLVDWGKKITWHPEYMKHRYDNWVKGLQWDWLISNQRHFGVSFPLWYCGDCEEIIVASEKNLPIDPIKDKCPVDTCPKCKSNNIIPETDVLNTWFTSSMTPQIATQLIEDKEVQKKLFPMDLRPQAHDIITFWLFNTVVKSQLHFKKNPWKETAISGFVTLNKQKMSKSKGNVVRPQEVIEKYSADAIRYWAASSKLGEDFDYQEKDVVTGTKFINKIVNAAKFSFMNSSYQREKPELQETDRLFLNRLNDLIKSATDSFEKYNYSAAKLATDKFFWHMFTDNYLEIIKDRMYNGTKKEKASASYTLYQTLLTVIKLFAPITPFITEELYHEYFKKHEKEKSIHSCEWPNQITLSQKKDDQEKWDKLLEIVSRVRQAKSEAKKSMKAEIILTLSKKEKGLLADVLSDLQSVTTAKEIQEGTFNVQFV